MVKAEDILRHELIGLNIAILDSTNKEIVGMSGVVSDESRNTITIEKEGFTKTVPKGECVFSFKLPSGKRVKVKGKLLIGRPEDRTKKKFKKW